MYIESTRNIEVEVVPEFLQEEPSVGEPVYFFKYTVKIKNLSSETVQLLDRHWIITDGQGRTEHVQGSGVVGMQPILKPGQEFTYNSGCPLTTKTGNMRGTYRMRTEKEHFDVRIPLFFLRHPDTFSSLLN